MADYQADPFDAASEQEAESRDSAIKAVMAQANTKPPFDFDGKHCMDCGEEIVSERLALGKWTCIYCQSLKEKRR